MILPINKLNRVFRTMESVRKILLNRSKRWVAITDIHTHIQTYKNKLSFVLVLIQKVTPTLTQTVNEYGTYSNHWYRNSNCLQEYNIKELQKITGHNSCLDITILIAEWYQLIWRCKCKDLTNMKKDVGRVKAV